ncbi:MAG: TolC family protein [Candidatus Hydrogenedentes bacterium]|nr:TolC family protein [Candidatus Hydrogenedentota bacterium]
MSTFRSICTLASLAALCGLLHADPVVSPEPAGVLTLESAIDAALTRNPKLNAFSWELRATDARILQAGLRPNPELSLEIEDIRLKSGPAAEGRTASVSGVVSRDTFSLPVAEGDPLQLPIVRAKPVLGYEVEREQGARSGLAESEFTLSLSQIVELGGKRAKRVALATNEKDLVRWDYEGVRADVIAGTARAYIDVVAAQESLDLQNELVRLAEEVSQTVAARVEAGQVSPIQEGRAGVALSMVQLERDRAVRDLEIARVRLAAMWGSGAALFERAEGSLPDVAPVPPAEQILERVTANPDIARWTAEIAARDARHSLERSRRVPDPVLSLGLRATGLGDRGGSRIAGDSERGFEAARTRTAFDDDWDTSLVAGLSFPLPIFDRNQGNIAEAAALASKASDERKAVEVTVRAALSEAVLAAAGACDEAVRLRDEVLSNASGILEKTRVGFEMGKFNYLDVLDAQRTLFEVRTDALDARRRYHLALVDIERLTGDGLQAWARQAGENSHDE